MCTLCKQDKIPIPHGNEWKGSFLKVKGLALPSGYGSKAFCLTTVLGFLVLGHSSQSAQKFKFINDHAKYTYVFEYVTMYLIIHMVCT